MKRSVSNQTLIQIESDDENGLEINENEVICTCSGSNGNNSRDSNSNSSVADTKGTNDGIINYDADIDTNVADSVTDRTTDDAAKRNEKQTEQSVPPKQSATDDERCQRCDGMSRTKRKKALENIGIVSWFNRRNSLYTSLLV